MLYPLAIDLKDKTILVVGGGKVATRKVKRLLNYQCTVVVITPIITDTLREIIENLNANTQCTLRWEKQWYQFEILEITQPHLVLACTDDETVNQRIVEHCRRMGILVNSATHGHYPGDCITPNTFARANNQVQAALWTTENLPLLSQYLLKKMEAILNDEEDKLIASIKTLTALKQYLKTVEPDQVQRSQILKTVFEHPDFWNRLLLNESTQSPEQLIAQLVEQPSNSPAL